MQEDDWSILFAEIRGLDTFNDVYGFVAGDDVLRFTAMILGEVVDESGTGSDFIGHVGGDDFVIISSGANGPGIQEQVAARFDREVLTFYSFRDRERGWLEVRDPDGSVHKRSLMRLAVGLVTAHDGPFSDIRELTEAAAEARRTVS
jgi:GGDEF domain-containing protein